MTSRKLKPTAGPWAVDYKYFNRVVGQSGVVAECKRQTMHTSVQDNALLIAEAGTVHHECGLSPRELLEGYRELRGALSLFHLDSPNMTLADLRVSGAALAKHKEV